MRKRTRIDTRSTKGRSATPRRGNPVRTNAAVPPLVTRKQITVQGNGVAQTAEGEVRMALVDFIREHLGLTGTHVGCEHGVCGACTILLDGAPVRSCLMFAVQAAGEEITTVEALGTPDRLHPIQEAFRDHHGLQCGFCTPGFLMTTLAFLRERPSPTADEIRVALAGHLCRCTGYQGIVEAVSDAAARLTAGTPTPAPRARGGARERGNTGTRQ